MASKEISACCAETNFHDGAPTGKHINLFGLDTYVAGKESPKVIVIVTDIFGNHYNNTLLIADRFAKAGYYTLVPDILDGDDADPTTFFADLELREAWLKRHAPEITGKFVQGFLDKLKVGLKYEFLGIIGYCFGARYAVQQLSSKANIASAGAIAHPSRVGIEDIAAISKPILISAAETDPVFPEDLRHDTEDKLREIGATYQIDLFSGVSHGYAVRGDLSNPAVAYAKEKTFLDQVYFFDFHSKSK